MRKLSLAGFAVGTLIMPAMAAVGGGLEWAPWANDWLVRAEYLNYNFSGVLVGSFGASDLTIGEVRAGLAYKF